MPLPSLWIYKCNASRGGPLAAGDWDEFFAGPQPGLWGGSATMNSPLSLSILWKRMQPRDLVLCWQTNRRSAVGLCRVDSFDDDVDDEGTPERWIRLQLLGEPFSPPVPLLDLRKDDRKLATVRCFQSGNVSTLYGTSSGERDILLRTCGISPNTLRRLRSSRRRDGLPRRGAGFGSAAENLKVEKASLKKFNKSYKGWEIIDCQNDNCGYDFRVRRGTQERHIELKGARGPMPSFPITDNEVNQAKEDGRWRLAVVTGALSSPKLTEWTSKQFLRQFDLRPLVSYMARLRK